MSVRSEERKLSHMVMWAEAMTTSGAFVPRKRPRSLGVLILMPQQV